MKVTMKDGIVICIAENPIEKLHEFLSECWYCLEGYYGYGNLKLWEREDKSLLTEEGKLNDTLFALEGLINNADKFGVPVDDEVRELLKNKQQEMDEFFRQKKLNKEQKENENRWKLLCANGCGSCKHKRKQVFGDDIDFVCAETGAYLETKNQPYYVGYIYQLFHSVPYPNEDCPYNVNKKRGELKNV